MVSNTIINDAVVFEGNLIFGCKELEFKTKKAGLYLWRRRDQALIQLRSDQICSNGKAVVRNADGSLTLFDIDSPSKQIIRCRLDIEAGTVSDISVVVDLTSEEVFPDGMILTPDHQSLIVALYDPGDPKAGAARQYNISTGNLETIWTCPGSPRVTCPQLVRHQGRVRLVLTTAVEHMPPEQQATHPNAGCLFIGDTAFSDIGDQPVFPSAGNRTRGRLKGPLIYRIRGWTRYNVPVARYSISIRGRLFIEYAPSAIWFNPEPQATASPESVACGSGLNDEINRPQAAGECVSLPAEVV